MIPVHVHTLEFEEPPDRVYYLAAANGTWLVNKGELFTAITPARRGVPGLAPLAPQLALTLPKIPRPVMERVFGLFRTVFRLYDGEAIAILFYRPATSDFRIRVPPQRLVRHQTPGRWRTSRQVRYGYVPRMDGFLKIGDAHSHAELPAFFSCTDDHDDAEDGLRIVLGSLDRRHPDVSVSFVTNGVRFLLEAEQVLEAFSVPLTPPRAWLEQVTCEPEGADARRPTDATARC